MEDKKINGFTLTKAALRNTPDLTPSQRFVLVTLADYANDKGISYPAQDTIAKITGYGRMTIWRAIHALVDKQYLTIAERHGRALKYQLSTQHLMYHSVTSDVSECNIADVSQCYIADVSQCYTNITIDNITTENISIKEAEEEEKKNPVPSASASAASVNVSVPPTASKPLPPFSTESFERFKGWAIRDDVWSAIGPIIAPKLPAGLDREGQRNAIGGIMRQLHALIATKTINGTNPVKFVAAVLRGEIDRFVAEPTAESVTASSMPFGSIAEKLAALVPLYQAEYPDSEHIDCILDESNVPEYLIAKLRGCKTIGLARAILSEHVAMEVAQWRDAEIRNRREDNMRNVEKAIEAGTIKPDDDGKFSWRAMQRALLGQAS